MKEERLRLRRSPQDAASAQVMEALFIDGCRTPLPHASTQHTDESIIRRLQSDHKCITDAFRPRLKEAARLRAQRQTDPAPPHPLLLPEHPQSCSVCWETLLHSAILWCSQETALRAVELPRSSEVSCSLSSAALAFLKRFKVHLQLNFL